ncbi:hypothetical protein ABZS88_46695 [Streptomyces sp. NPDC005480]|uniref:hypothetical protein n=1 Tax=Streptomyces sp. NPDC005480 TaxID=3154880 RepID=UPI0033A88988
MARGADISAPAAWIGIDDPACRRTLTLHRAADSRLSAAAGLMHTTLATWPWNATGNQQSGNQQQ